MTLIEGEPSIEGGSREPMRQGCPEGVSSQALQGSTTKVVPIESFAQDDPI